jgi:hypothetical protein
LAAHTAVGPGNNLCFVSGLATINGSTGNNCSILPMAPEQIAGRILHADGQLVSAGAKRSQARLCLCLQGLAGDP